MVLFLLFKATVELHERLEGHSEHDEEREQHLGFGLVVTQIVVLDAVFSLDSVITAVGMVDHLYVMVIAVVIAMAVMIYASKALTTFVNSHPTVVVLCLSFLLMIGFSLIAEGFGLSYSQRLFVCCYWLFDSYRVFQPNCAAQSN